jgi:hypothetical protein
VRSPAPYAPADLKALAVNDAETMVATLAEAPALGPIGANAPGDPRTSVTDRVLVVPPASGRGQKRIYHAMKRSNPVPLVDKVMTQVELPPYCGPRSPLDLVVINIVFGCIFEAFC